MFFWYPTPNPNSPPEFDRADWYWLLGVIFLVQILRLAVERRLWTPTLFYPWFAAFFVLCLLNIHFSPYPSRGLLMLARPALGVMWVIYMVETARNTRSMRSVLMLMLALALLVGWTAMVTSQWRRKSLDFLFILDHLPRLKPFYAAGGFNPNEIAGAIAWLVPIAAGLMLFQWYEDSELASVDIWRSVRLPASRILAYLSGIAFVLLLLALILGQSRSAIIGVILALFAMTVTIVPKGRARYLSLLGVGFLVVLQWSVSAHVFPNIGGNPDSEVAQIGLALQDERTTNQRLDVWTSAYNMIKDYPLTGVGMARFRSADVRADYPIPDFDYPKNPAQTNFRKRIMPHAHNEFVQITTDLGLPGFVVFTAWNLVAVYMLWWCWWRGGRQDQVIAVALASGLFAHGIYGMGDAIPLWDRFSFVYWWILGSAAAQYTLLQSAISSKKPSS